MRRAVTMDARLLLEMMTEFYGESGYPVDAPRALLAFERLLDDERLGAAWILEAEGRTAGYAVMTLGYSMEYGGRDAFVDDLFVRSAFRGRGLGRQAIAAIRAESERLGVRALHLEVDRGNTAAQALYRKAGFAGNDRQLLTLQLGDPLHVS